MIYMNEEPVLMPLPSHLPLSLHYRYYCYSMTLRGCVEAGHAFFRVLWLVRHLVLFLVILVTLHSNRGVFICRS